MSSTTELLGVFQEQIKYVPPESKLVLLDIDKKLEEDRPEEPNVPKVFALLVFKFKLDVKFLVAFVYR